MVEGGGGPLDPLRGVLNDITRETLAERFYDVEDGTIDFVGLAELLAGGLLVTLGAGWTAIISALADGVEMLLGGVVGFIGLVEETVLGGLFQITFSIMGGAASLSELGPLAAPVGLTIAVVALYVLSRAEVSLL